MSRYDWRPDGNYLIRCTCTQCEQEYDAHALSQFDPTGRCPACRYVDAQTRAPAASDGTKWMFLGSDGVWHLGGQLMSADEREILFELDEETYKRLEAYARKEGLPVEEILRRAVLQYLNPPR